MHQHRDIKGAFDFDNCPVVQLTALLSAHKPLHKPHTQCLRTQSRVHRAASAYVLPVPVVFKAAQTDPLAPPPPGAIARLRVSPEQLGFVKQLSARSDSTVFALVRNAPGAADLQAFAASAPRQNIHVIQSDLADLASIKVCM